MNKTTQQLQVTNNIRNKADIVRKAANINAIDKQNGWHCCEPGKKIIVTLKCRAAGQDENSTGVNFVCIKRVGG